MTTPRQWQRALAWWLAGRSGYAIAARLGITPQAVYQYARRHAWPRRDRETTLRVPGRPHGRTAR